ncbi:MAG: T9SS type A sorting domain-containing protein [Paludibacteraceae bacterium]|nr:T9SS type A sorting domain-containing protein [Paludibacteraceae bacterium]
MRISLFLCISICATLSAQTIHFIYDNAGNRTVRYIDMSYDQDGVVNEEDESGREIKDSLESNQIHIYPNPTDGHLSIRIDSLKKDQSAFALLIDTDGKNIVYQYANKNDISIDFSDRDPGIYILRIEIGNLNTEWKIIKK